MKSPKVESAKVEKTNVSKTEETKAKGKNLNDINLDSLKDKSLKSDMSDKFKETSKSTKDNIYKIDYNLMSTEQQKKFRNKCRNRLNSFSKDILGKDRTDKERTNGIINFLKFYKETYRINNFELNSVRSKISNEADKRDLISMLEVVKTFLKDNEIEF